MLKNCNNLAREKSTEGYLEMRFALKSGLRYSLIRVFF